MTIFTNLTHKYNIYHNYNKKCCRKQGSEAAGTAAKRLQQRRSGR